MGSKSVPDAKAPEGLTSADIKGFADGSGVTAQNSTINSMISNPETFLAGMQLSDRTPLIDPNTAGTNLNPNDADYQVQANQLNYVPNTVAVTETAMAPTPTQAMTYGAATSADRVSNVGQAVAKTGTVNPNAIVTAPTIDVKGSATGVNEDGSRNYTGEALNDVATLGISNVIDTTTVSGKLLAQALGEGNYTDAKATVQGQMELLSKQFVDPVTGEPKIPSWAAGLARNVSRIAAFKGMTGTAATAAMSQAIMEASLPIAQQDAQFFQTATLKNLDNRQQTVIQKAQVLAKIDLANMDARMNAAVTNSRNFMEMDLTNLNNLQQTEIINTQARVQSILEDTKAENASRLFGAESQNDFTKFYDNLTSQISMFNSEQRNAMERFNTGELNSAAQFNATLENQRELFYKEMQYNVDLANARWRQSVVTANTQMQFTAAQTDVQNMYNLTMEGLNRLWDRTDALLDYTWKSAESDLDRKAQIAVANLQKPPPSGGIAGSLGKILGSMAGTDAGATALANTGSKVFAVAKTAFAALGFSDTRLKTNIKHIETSESGIKIYSWTWNDEAKRLGADTIIPIGVLAQEVLEHTPEAVITGPDGYYRVDYGKLKWK
jgi:hypothetical protein